MAVLISENAGGEFAEQILEELIREGYNDQSLIDQFRRRRQRIRPAVDLMLEKAHRLALDETPDFAYDQILGK